MEVQKRRGVASIVGTVIFVVVFMLALGSLAYASGLQAQASQAEAQAQTVAAQKGSEVLTFSTTGSGVQADNGGAYSVSVNHLVLRFANGTVYALPAVAVIPSGGEVGVLSLVPSGVCSPGTATCVSKYDSIISGAAPGSSVGLVTGLGNVFWYSASSSQGGWTEVTIAASALWSVPSGAASVYVVCVGGGGGGGGSGGATDGGGVAGSGGSGGGGVGSLAQGFVDLAGASSVQVTIGAGGSAGTGGSATTSGGAGGTGGSSSFGTFLACAGGEGGGGSLYNYNGAGGSSCSLGSGPAGGAGGGVPGGFSSVTGTAADALQATEYGGGGGGGGTFSTPAGSGSPSDSLTSGALFTGLPGASGNCAMGGGGGSASPFADGGTGGAGATGCSSGGQGGSARPNTGAGGGGAGGSYSTSLSCGGRSGQPGGSGGSGVVVVYYQ
ncbi:MAG: hypothetical protein JRM73_04835 [Nitrososphaerota archaeon]|nr:hypothetical protein [Nitrososphaerota archaeon]